ncbi:MAG: hypothetical protein IPG07_09640 [Crocinitomicaceae bacterium]|nr:hypothetical protein [Crocinitomicaceae bacterium]
MKNTNYSSQFWTSQLKLCKKQLAELEKEINDVVEFNAEMKNNAETVINHSRNRQAKTALAFIVYTENFLNCLPTQNS